MKIGLSFLQLRFGFIFCLYLGGVKASLTHSILKINLTWKLFCICCIWNDMIILVICIYTWNSRPTYKVHVISYDTLLCLLTDSIKGKWTYLLSVNCSIWFQSSCIEYNTAMLSKRQIHPAVIISITSQIIWPVLQIWTLFHIMQTLHGPYSKWVLDMKSTARPQINNNVTIMNEIPRRGITIS